MAAIVAIPPPCGYCGALFTLHTWLHMRALKIIGAVLAGLVALVLVAIAAAYLASGRKMSRRHDVTVAAVAIPTDSASIARGEHIAKAISGCADCHAADLGGGLIADAGPMGLLAAPNLTRGSGGLGSQLTDVDFVRAIRYGVRPDGTSLLMMPSAVFAHMTDADLGAVIAYVEHVPPVDRTPPTFTLRIVGRILLALGKLPVLSADLAANQTPEQPVMAEPTAEYGRYLVRIGGCQECHGPALSGGPIPAGPPGAPPAANLTPAGQLGTWTESDFVHLIREGKRPDGSPINEAMPWKVLRGMTDDELQALWLYLRTLPSKQMGAM
jgi:mono/diheme cytochrome c family protein